MSGAGYILNDRLADPGGLDGRRRLWDGAAGRGPRVSHGMVCWNKPALHVPVVPIFSCTAAWYDGRRRLWDGAAPSQGGGSASLAREGAVNPKDSSGIWQIRGARVSLMAPRDHHQVDAEEFLEWWEGTPRHGR